jgi:NADH:ubiquinone oxidoreductase subunit E
MKKPLERFGTPAEARRALKSHQKPTLRMLASVGYQVAVAYGHREALEFIKAYLGISSRSIEELVLLYPKSELIPANDEEIIYIDQTPFDYSRIKAAQ